MCANFFARLHSRKLEGTSSLHQFSAWLGANRGDAPMMSVERCFKVPGCNNDVELTFHCFQGYGTENAIRVFRSVLSS